jgi:Icc-related predicted phosphoesterase
MRRVGKPLAKDVRVRDVIEGKSYDTAGNQPLPSPYAAAVVTPDKVGITDPGAELRFLFCADWGGIEDPNPQKAVVAAMAARLPGPAFLYIGGDLNYFDGDPAQWPLQFYQPLEHFPIPVVAVPGNHDGDPTDGVPGAGIASFMKNMCTPTPVLPDCDPHDEFGRDTQTQPSHDWGLLLQAVTILGVWTNVASGGHLEPEQITWLTDAVQHAPTDRPLIIVEHHPPYSISADGGSSPQLNAVFDGIWNAAGRWPELILSGHVHDYQRFTRTVQGKTPTYLVQGAGGYHNRHPLAGDAVPGMDVLGDGSLIFEQGFADEWSFTEVTVAAGVITGETFGVPLTGPVTTRDQFTIQT